MFTASVVKSSPTPYMSNTLNEISSHPFIQSSGLKEGVMRPRGLSFPLADHMNCLVSGGIRSYLGPPGLLETHSTHFFSLCLKVRHCLSISPALVLRKHMSTVKKWNKNNHRVLASSRSSVKLTGDTTVSL